MLVLNRLNTYIGLVLMLLVVGCNFKNTPQEYTAWVEDLANGLHTEKQIDGFNYAIQYKPVDYILKKKNNAKLSAADYEDLHYIDLELSHEAQPDYLKIDLAAREDYYQRLKYFSFEIEKDIRLVDGSDTLKCVFSHFERTYGVTPYIKVVLAFDKVPGSENDLFFTYHDQLFNNGIVNLPIKRQAIKNIPST